jgi:hypothetical protein
LELAREYILSLYYDVAEGERMPKRKKAKKGKKLGRSVKRCAG